MFYSLFTPDIICVALPPVGATECNRLFPHTLQRHPGTQQQSIHSGSLNGLGDVFVYFICLQKLVPVKSLAWFGILQNVKEQSAEETSYSVREAQVQVDWSSLESHSEDCKIVFSTGDDQSSPSLVTREGQRQGPLRRVTSWSNYPNGTQSPGSCIRVSTHEAREAAIRFSFLQIPSSEAVRTRSFT